jgi:hypothetical protein
MRSWAVLLRLSGLDALVADAELESPGGELGDAGDGTTGERNAIVGTNRSRDAELIEDLLEGATGGRHGGGAQANAGDEIPAVRIGDGERVAQRLADAEVAFEVDAPDVVWLVACARGADDGGVERLRRRGRIRPLRLKIEANVLIEGNSAPGFARNRAAWSFLGPQCGRCLRAATIASSIHAATA